MGLGSLLGWSREDGTARSVCGSAAKRRQLPGCERRHCPVRPVRPLARGELGSRYWAWKAVAWGWRSLFCARSSSQMVATTRFRAAALSCSARTSAGRRKPGGRGRVGVGRGGGTLCSVCGSAVKRRLPGCKRRHWAMLPQPVRVLGGGKRVWRRVAWWPGGGAERVRGVACERLHGDASGRSGWRAVRALARSRWYADTGLRACKWALTACVLWRACRGAGKTCSSVSTPSTRATRRRCLRTRSPTPRPSPPRPSGACSSRLAPGGCRRCQQRNSAICARCANEAFRGSVRAPDPSGVVAVLLAHCGSAAA